MSILRYSLSSLPHCAYIAYFPFSPRSPLLQQSTDCLLRFLWTSLVYISLVGQQVDTKMALPPGELGGVWIKRVDDMRRQLSNALEWRAAVRRSVLLVLATHPPPPGGDTTDTHHCEDQDHETNAHHEPHPTKHFYEVYPRHCLI